MTIPPMSTQEPPILVIESHDATVDDDLNAFESGNPGVMTLMTAKSFSAAEHSLQALVPLVPIATGVVTLIATWIRAKRHVVITVGGVTLKGLSAREAERVLNQIIESGDTLGVLDAQAAQPDDEVTSG